MAHSPNSRDDGQAVLERLADEGLVQMPETDFNEILLSRGPLDGPVTDAGTRALAEQRGERG